MDVYFITNQKLQITNTELLGQIGNLKYINEIHEYNFEELFKTNINENSNKYEIGVRLNGDACFDCNKSIVSLMRYKFKNKSNVYILYKKDSMLAKKLSLNKNRIIYCDSLFEFKTVKPVIFVKSEASYLYKFSPNADFPELTMKYLNLVEGFIN